MIMVKEDLNEKAVRDCETHGNMCGWFLGRRDLREAFRVRLMYRVPEP